MNAKEAKQFVAHFVKGDYTLGEYAAFLRWLKGSTLEELNEIADEHEALYDQWDVAGLSPTAEWIDRLESKLDRQVNLNSDIIEEGVKEVLVVNDRRGADWIATGVIGKSRSIGRKVWVAAASVVVLLGAAGIWYSQQVGVKQGKSREMPANAKTIENPRGGTEKELLLADGSKVLLNVASSLRYPEAFSGSERVVELSGEAYFEVKPDAARPFRVLIKDAEVDVLGTKFNIRAYADEPVCKTTLIDGSVGIESKSDRKELSPGQQGIITYASTGDISIVRHVGIDDVMAWKTGYFQFRNEEFQVVARVLSRYYNVEIQCDPRVARYLVSGSVSRDKGLKESLKQFEASEKFTIEWGAKVIKVTL
jgi:ferric-dicitrate binding protein FerR (iron transport regulator)